jgi:hypothetical protein
MDVPSYHTILSSGRPVKNCRVRANRAIFAAIFNITLIQGTFIIIIAMPRTPRSTHGVSTNVIYRARVSSRTRHGVRRVDTSSSIDITEIVRAEVSITTILSDS